MIYGRHIRHDWKTFVDWQQNSVSTVCGATTRRHLAGIPGITEQEDIVPGPDERPRWGWCMHCVRVGYRQYLDTNLQTMDPDVAKLYERFFQAIEGQYAFYHRQEIIRQVPS